MSEMYQILLIDDDYELGELLQEYLAMEGYQLAVCHDGESGLAAALTGQYNLVLLDVMLPKMNGFDVLKQLRTESMLPVIMLTARGDSVDRVLGLEHGADDYIPKPYHHHELVARIKALFRRIEAGQPKVANAWLQVDELKLHKATRSVRLHDEEVELTGAEFGVLLTLLESAGEVVDKEVLSQSALGRRLSAFDRSIDMHVSNLRKKLGERNDGKAYIKTVRGQGYILVQD